MSLNIFQIWDKIGRKTPFAVRRDNWIEEYYTIVEKVECVKMPYGKAYGYPTINGQYSTHYEYDSKWRKHKIIPCCGCYQWTFVENSNLKKSEEGLKANVKSIKAAYTINSLLYFGKHQGKTIKEVFSDDSGYIEWAIINIDIFFLTPEAFEYLNNLKPDFKFNETTRKLNNKKVDKRQKL